MLDDNLTVTVVYSAQAFPTSLRHLREVDVLEQGIYILDQKWWATPAGAERDEKKAPGQAAKLCHMGHVLMENRHGLVVATEMTQATGTAEHEAAQAMIDVLDPGRRITLGADKGYDTRDFVAGMRRRSVTPHVAQNTKGCCSAIDRRTTRHRGTAVSVRVRKRIEEVFG